MFVLLYRYGSILIHTTIVVAHLICISIDGSILVYSISLAIHLMLMIYSILLVEDKPIQFKRIDQCRAMESIIFNHDLGFYTMVGLFCCYVVIYDHHRFCPMDFDHVYTNAVYSKQFLSLR